MALIDCPECSRQISNKAPACPHCGVPMPPAEKEPIPANAVQPVVSSPDEAQAEVKRVGPGYPYEAPTSTPPKKETSWGTWLTALFLAGAAIWYFQSPLYKNQYKPEMPVKVGFRPSITGPGLVLRVENSSDRHLSILATLTNPSINDSRNFRLDVPPGGTSETGYREGWRLASGDRIVLTHDDYRNWQGSIP